MPGGVAQAAVAERVVAAVPAILEQAALHPRHPLGVEIALELGGQAQLAEHEPPGGTVEVGAGHAGDQQRYLMALELVAQVEHQAGIAGEAGQVVDGDRRDLAAAERL